MLHTINDVYDSRARELCGEGLADMNLKYSRHQIMRFIGWDVFVKPLNLQVFVVIVRTAFEPSLRKFDVL